MKQMIVALAAYNQWATARLVHFITGLPESLQGAPAPSSYPSLHKTMHHLWESESVWWQRITGAEEKVRLNQESTASAREAGRLLLQVDQWWADWVPQQEDADFERIFHYKNSRGEFFSQPVWEALLHLFNHGTYHRGQLVTQLRILEVSGIPATDLIIWSRNKQG